MDSLILSIAQGTDETLFQQLATSLNGTDAVVEDILNTYLPKSELTIGGRIGWVLIIFHI